MDHRHAGDRLLAVLFDAPAECLSPSEFTDDTPALALPPIPASSESGPFTIESGTPVLDNLDPDAGEIPLPDGRYQICLFWIVPGSIGGGLVTSFEAEIGSPAPEPTTTAAPTTTTTAAPAEPVTPRYTG